MILKLFLVQKSSWMDSSLMNKLKSSDEWTWSIPQMLLKNSRRRAENTTSEIALSKRSTSAGRRQEGDWIPVGITTTRKYQKMWSLEIWAGNTEGIIWDNSNEAGLIKKSYSIARNKHDKFSKFYLNKNSISIFYKQLLQRIPNFGSKATSKK